LPTVSSERPAVFRGEVWLVALDPSLGSEQAKTRPCIVVQRDAANAASRTTIVVPVTDAARQTVGAVKPLLRKHTGGLTKDSVALCHQVRTVDRLRLRKRLGRLPDDALAEVSAGLALILDWEG
jgi:mRNA interferase MazF